MKEFTINVPFTAVMTNDPSGYTYVEGPVDASCYARTEAKAKRVLKASLKHAVTEALIHKKEYRRRMIMTVSGIVLLVEFDYGCWGYTIWGKDRNGHSGSQGFKDFDETLSYARKHAVDSYDGIAWENS